VCETRPTTYRSQHVAAASQHRASPKKNRTGVQQHSASHPTLRGCPTRKTTLARTVWAPTHGDGHGTVTKDGIAAERNIVVLTFWHTTDNHVTLNGKLDPICR